MAVSPPMFIPPLLLLLLQSRRRLRRRRRLPSKAGGGGGLLHGHDAQVHDLVQELLGLIALPSSNLPLARVAIQDPKDPVRQGPLSQRMSMLFFTKGC